MSLLTVDVSNTHTSFVFWPTAGAERHWAIGTDPRRTSDELGFYMTQLLARDGIQQKDVSAVALACVVPAAQDIVVEVCNTLFAAPPLVVGPGVRTGLRVRTEYPRELGPDRVANAVAARARFGSPVLVLDFSTALTIDVVGPKGDYLGAIIAPSMSLAADALARRTARLHRIDLVPPEHAIGRNTDEGLRSGLVLGYMGLVEGLVLRLQDELAGMQPEGSPPATVVATGESPDAAVLITHSELIDAHEPLLTHEGLRRIWELQKG